MMIVGALQTFQCEFNKRKTFTIKYCFLKILRAFFKLLKIKLNDYN